MKNKDIFDYLIKGKYDNKYESLISKKAKTEICILMSQCYPNYNQMKLTEKFMKNFKKKWNETGRQKGRFINRYEKWLNMEFIVNELQQQVRINHLQRGAPSKSFEDLSTRSKKRRSSEITEKLGVTTESLFHALILNLNKEGRNKDAKVLKHMMESKVDGSCNVSCSKVYSAEEALALMLDCRMSRADYQTIRQGALDKGCMLYPAYNFIVKSKSDCIPDSGIVTTNYSASVNLQGIMDHTTNRIWKVIDKSKLPEPCNTLLLISKVGFDGSTGQSVYKQRTEDEEDRLSVSVEESLFLSCTVPVQLKVQETNVILWTNPKTSSTQYCRPVRMQYVKENQQIVKAEYDFFMSTELRTTTIDLFQVKHKLECTMIDGKVSTLLSPLTDSYQVCNICGLNPKKMNDFVIAYNKQPNQMSLDLGIHTLHLWIRCFECLLHIGQRRRPGYNDCGFFHANTPEKKNIVASRKKEIQEKIKDTLGLVVDVPRSGGSGTSNDGNTARRAFRSHETFAEILGIDKGLVKRFFIILCVLSCKHPIDPDKLELYCKETFKTYVAHFKWYPMPVGVHKMIVHSHQVVKDKPVPIGLLSEEAQESRNKDVKNFREHFTRKFSRKLTNEDVMRRLLCSSDPFITSMRRSSESKKELELPAECLDLLL